MDNQLVPLSRNEKIFFVVIFAFTLFTRFFGLSIQSLWYDELFTALALQYNSLSEYLASVVVKDVHPPLYSTIIYYVVHIFGGSEAALRMPSAIFSVGAVYGMFRFGRKVYSNGVGILAALFTSIFWLPVYMGQEARSYSLIFFLSTYFFYYHYEITTTLSRNENLKKSSAILFVVFATLLSYLYYYSLFIVAFSAIFLLFLAPKQLAKAAGLYALAAILYIPWVPYMIGQANHGSLWMEKIALHRLITSIDIITFSYRPFTILLLLIMLAYTVRKLLETKSDGSWRSLGRRIVFEKHFYLIMFIVLPFFAIMALNRVYINKYYSVIMPALYVFLAASILGVSQRKFVSKALIALVTVLALYATFGINSYYSPTKCDYRSASSYIMADERGACYPILVHGFYFFDVPKEMTSYYFRDESSKRQYETFDGRGNRADTVIRNLRIANADTVWFITDGIFDYADVDSAINCNFTLLDCQRFHRIRLWKLELDSPRASQGMK